MRTNHLHSKPPVRRRPRRQPGQSVVEFGLVALIFCLLLFGIADFGLLLNGWINISSGTREGARQAAVGADYATIQSAARASARVPGVSPSALQVEVSYCRPTGPSCSSLNVVAAYGGSCTTSCAVPGSGDTVTVTVRAPTFQVVTPLVRPFFGCTDGSAPTCYVPLSSVSTVRFEGTAL